MSTRPKLYIISGCNGAGKTTASFTLLPELLKCRQFVNADEIARGLSPFDIESVAFAAGRIMLLRVAELMAQRKTFAIETTLATRSYGHLVKAAKRAGYQVELLFIWLNSPQMARMRVAQRVKEGGHDIPDHVIDRRYRLGIINLFEVFIPLVDMWTLVDNSSGRLEIIASSKKIANQSTFNQIYQIYDRSRNGQTAGATT